MCVYIFLLQFAVFVRVCAIKYFFCLTEGSVHVLFVKCISTMETKLVIFTKRCFFLICHIGLI